MMTALWDEGTARRSSEEIAAELAGIGASLSLVHRLGYDLRAAVHLEAASRQGAGHLRRRAPQSDLSPGGVGSPAGDPPGPLDPSPRRAAAAGQHGGRPTALRSGASLRPAASSATPRRCEASRREDIEQFYRRTFVRKDAGLIAVGDITMEELTAELEKVLGGWQSAAGRAPATRSSRPCRRRQPTTARAGRQAGCAAVGDFGRPAGRRPHARPTIFGCW